VDVAASDEKVEPGREVDKFIAERKKRRK
jgi:hypothetical protein